MSSSAINTRVTTSETSRVAPVPAPTSLNRQRSPRVRPDRLAILTLMPDCRVTVVLPCLNESESLPGVLAAMPGGYVALVVDNNSTDGTADVAERCGARVVAEGQPGYGAAVHAGIEAASTPIVAVIDGDGSLDPGDLPALVAELDRGADMVVGRRRPGPGV